MIVGFIPAALLFMASLVAAVFFDAVGRNWIYDCNLSGSDSSRRIVSLRTCA